MPLEPGDQDLFGQPVKPVEWSRLTGKPKRVTPKKGYAARPGSGPAGETCRSCKHARRVGGGNKYFSKCALISKNWTRGPGTDILLKSPACQLWEKDEPQDSPPK